MHAQVRYPPLPAERRMIHVGFRETLPTARLPDMRAIAARLLLHH